MGLLNEKKEALYQNQSKDKLVVPDKIPIIGLCHV